MRRPERSVTPTLETRVQERWYRGHVHALRMGRAAIDTSEPHHNPHLDVIQNAAQKERQRAMEISNALCATIPNHYRFEDGKKKRFPQFHFDMRSSAPSSQTRPKTPTLTKSPPQEVKPENHKPPNDLEFDDINDFEIVAAEIERIEREDEEQRRRLQRSRQEQRRRAMSPKETDEERRSTDLYYQKFNYRYHRGDIASRLRTVTEDSGMMVIDSPPGVGEVLASESPPKLTPLLDTVASSRRKVVVDGPSLLAHERPEVDADDPSLPRIDKKWAVSPTKDGVKKARKPGPRKGKTCNLSFLSPISEGMGFSGRPMTPTRIRYGSSDEETEVALDGSPLGARDPRDANRKARSASVNARVQKPDENVRGKGKRKSPRVNSGSTNAKLALLQMEKDGLDARELYESSSDLSEETARLTGQAKGGKTHTFLDLVEQGRDDRKRKKHRKKEKRPDGMEVVNDMPLGELLMSGFAGNRQRKGSESEQQSDKRPNGATGAVKDQKRQKAQSLRSPNGSVSGPQAATAAVKGSSSARKKPSGRLTKPTEKPARVGSGKKLKELVVDDGASASSDEEAGQNDRGTSKPQDKAHNAGNASGKRRYLTPLEKPRGESDSSTSSDSSSYSEDSESTSVKGMAVKEEQVRSGRSDGDTESGRRRRVAFAEDVNTPMAQSNVKKGGSKSPDDARVSDSDGVIRTDPLSNHDADESSRAGASADNEEHVEKHASAEKQKNEGENGTDGKGRSSSDSSSSSDDERSSRTSKTEESECNSSKQGKIEEADARPENSASGEQPGGSSAVSESVKSGNDLEAKGKEPKREHRHGKHRHRDKSRKDIDNGDANAVSKTGEMPADKRTDGDAETGTKASNSEKKQNLEESKVDSAASSEQKGADQSKDESAEQKNIKEATESGKRKHHHHHKSKKGQNVQEETKGATSAKTAATDDASLKDSHLAREQKDDLSGTGQEKSREAKSESEAQKTKDSRSSEEDVTQSKVRQAEHDGEGKKSDVQGDKVTTASSKTKDGTSDSSSSDSSSEDRSHRKRKNESHTDSELGHESNSKGAKESADSLGNSAKKDNETGAPGGVGNKDGVIGQEQKGRKKSDESSSSERTKKDGKKDKSETDSESVRKDDPSRSKGTGNANVASAGGVDKAQVDRHDSESKDTESTAIDGVSVQNDAVALKQASVNKEDDSSSKTSQLQRNGDVVSSDREKQTEKDKEKAQTTEGAETKEGSQDRPSKHKHRKHKHKSNKKESKTESKSEHASDKSLEDSSKKEAEEHGKKSIDEQKDESTADGKKGNEHESVVADRTMNRGDESSKAARNKESDKATENAHAQETKGTSESSSSKEEDKLSKKASAKDSQAQEMKGTSESSSSKEEDKLSKKASAKDSQAQEMKGTSESSSSKEEDKLSKKASAKDSQAQETKGTAESSSSKEEDKLSKKASARDSQAQETKGRSESSSSKEEDKLAEKASTEKGRDVHEGSNLVTEDKLSKEELTEEAQTTGTVDAANNRGDESELKRTNEEQSQNEKKTGEQSNVLVLSDTKIAEDKQSDTATKSSDNSSTEETKHLDSSTGKLQISSAAQDHESQNGETQSEEQATAKLADTNLMRDQLQALVNPQSQSEDVSKTANSAVERENDSSEERAKLSLTATSIALSTPDSRVSLSPSHAIALQSDEQESELQIGESFSYNKKETNPIRETLKPQRRIVTPERPPLRETLQETDSITSSQRARRRIVGTPKLRMTMDELKERFTQSDLIDEDDKDYKDLMPQRAKRDMSKEQNMTISGASVSGYTGVLELMGITDTLRKTVDTIRGTPSPSRSSVRNRSSVASPSASQRSSCRSEIRWLDS